MLMASGIWVCRNMKFLVVKLDVVSTLPSDDDGIGAPHV